MIRRVAALLTVIGLAPGPAALTPQPAQADSYYFGYSSGHHRHWGRHHGHWRPHYYTGYHYYPPPPRVIYVTPPPPPVVYSYAAPPPLAAVPTSPVYRAPNGQYCREYQADIRVDGVPQPSYGTACLQPDGSWRVAN